MPRKAKTVKTEQEIMEEGTVEQLPVDLASEEPEAFPLGDEGDDSAEQVGEPQSETYSEESPDTADDTDDDSADQVDEAVEALAALELGDFFAVPDSSGDTLLDPADTAEPEADALSAGTELEYEWQDPVNSPADASEDPALDPSLVIPNLPLPETQPESLSEPESTKSARRRASPATEDAASNTPTEAAATPSLRRGRKESPAPKRVVTIGDEANIQTDEEKEAYLWMELRNSMRGKRILTGILGGVERSANGLCTAVVYYKDRRIVIPASEMFINIGEDVKNDLKALYNRHAQILTRSLGSEMDFIISGIDRRGDSVVASRKEAMLRKQQNFFLPTTRNRTPLIGEGQIVEARVISVGDKNMRVEVFGAECTILAREVAWEWVDDCTEYYRIGDRVLVKILRIDDRDRQNIRINASIREAIPNPAQENIKKCVVQGKYIGKVTGVDRRAIYVRLNVGVNALAIAVHDRKIPCRKDDVSFVITRIDKEAGIAIGIITKVIKQFV